MGHGAKLRMRLYNANSDLVAKIDPFVKELIKEHNYNKIYLFDIRIEQVLSAGLAEIGAPNAIFDGTSSAAVVYIDSSTGNDAAAGTGVQACNLIALHEDGYPVNFPIVPVGITGTSTVTKFTRIMHHYATKWGGGNDADGDIFIQNDVGGATKYLKIGATFNESEGSAIFLPANYAAKIVYASFVPTDTSGTVGTWILKAVFTGFGGGVDPDYDYKIFGGGTLGNTLPQSRYSDIWYVDSGEDGKITFSETYIDQTASGFIHFQVVVWDTTSSAVPA